MTSDRFHELIEDYIDGTLDASGYKELQAAFDEDPTLAHAFDEEVQLAAQLSILHSNFSPDLPDAVQESLHRNCDAPDVSQAVIDEINHRQPDSVRFWTAPLAWAAVLAFGLGLATLSWFQSHQQPQTTSFATLSQVIDATWGDEAPRQQGAALTEEILELQRGVIRLDFDHGAVLTLQGPGRLEIKSSMRAVLHSGILTAQIPPAAIGFRVDTPVAEVVDLGTAFGILVGENGRTDVCVFEGEVEVGAPTQTTQLLEEGEALHAEHGTFSETAYDATPFQASWPVATGVVGMSGAFEFVRPGPPWNLAAYESDDAITVFPEHKHIRLERYLRVELAEPDNVLEGAKSNRRRLPAGTVLRSYLLQFNPASRSDEPARLNGSITFDQPVLGVLAGRSNLPGTDELFGELNSRYGSGKRGLEGPNQDPTGGQADRVSLSGDRRTLNLELLSRSEPDQIRVLVAIAESSREPL